MKKHIIIVLLAVFQVLGLSCTGRSSLEYDYVLSKSKLGNSKGTILLIHGQAPLNVDGRIPADDPSKYTKLYMYRDLAEELNKRGWDVARYGKYGVHKDHIDYGEYKKTDLDFTVKQLKDVWKRLPKDKPIIVFAASEGTLHAHFLPLDRASGVILLGAVSKNLSDVLLDAAESAGNRKIAEERIDKAFKMKRDEMLGRSAPAGRFVDEFKMDDNWTYYRRFQNIPLLILHGGADEEVKPYQTQLWKKNLPNHNITVIIKPKGNHIFGVADSFDAEDLAQTMDAWLSDKIRK